MNSWQPVDYQFLPDVTTKYICETQIYQTSFTSGKLVHSFRRRQKRGREKDRWDVPLSNGCVCALETEWRLKVSGDCGVFDGFTCTDKAERFRQHCFNARGTFVLETLGSLFFQEFPEHPAWANQRTAFQEFPEHPTLANQRTCSFP